MILQKIHKIIKLVSSVNICKTLYFNFRYLTVKDAFHLPFLIYYRTKLQKMGGEVIFNCPILMGMVKIGPHTVGTLDIKYARTIWEVNGCLIINGKTSFGRGTRLSIAKGATLTLGSDFIVSGASSIITQNSISFGNHCLLSWDILMMDTDFHDILDLNTNEIINPSKPIIIGNNVWIGCRTTILKGVKVEDSVIISANSILTKSCDQTNCIITSRGNDIRILKENVTWKA